eukprot:4858198-Pyramimonas_sp.AAC.1
MPSSFSSCCRGRSLAEDLPSLLEFVPQLYDDVVVGLLEGRAHGHPLAPAHGVLRCFLQDRANV